MVTKYLFIVVAFVVVMLALPFLGFSVFVLSVAYLTLLSVGMSVSWNILTGYTGYFNFGHASFFGVGVYVVAALSNDFGVNPLHALPIAGLFGALLALGVGYPCLKLRGSYFAIATLALTSVVMIFVTNQPSLKDGTGYFLSIALLQIPPFFPNRISFLYVQAFVVSLVTAIVSYLILKSRFGMSLIAIREDEDVAETMGIPTFRHKMAAFALSGFFGALVGGIYPFYQVFIDPPSVFNINFSMNAIIGAALGGTHDWRGPIIGATLLTLVSHYLTYTFSSELNLILLGIILIVIVTVMPRGIIGFIQERQVKLKLSPPRTNHQN